MKIVSTTEIDFDMKDIEKYLQDNNLLPTDHKVKKIVKTVDGIKIITTNTVEKTANHIQKQRPGADERNNAVLCTEEQMKLLSTPIEDLDLSVRLYNLLKLLNAETLKEMVQLTEKEFLAKRNSGRKSLEELKQVLAEKGLQMNMKLLEN